MEGSHVNNALQGIVLLVSHFLYVQAVYRCAPGWQLHGTDCFLLSDVDFTGRVTWHQAQHICDTMDSHLVEVLNHQQNAFVRDIINSHTWIGLHSLTDVEHFVWGSSNNKVDFSNWAVGQPSRAEQNCAALNGRWEQVGLWSDQSCNLPLRYICEKAKDSGDTSMCPPGWELFRDHCYWFSTSSKTWEDSRNDCKVRQADMVAVDSQFEQNYLISKVIRNLTWIGFHDINQEGSWRWLDETSQPVYSAWNLGEPDNSGNGPEDCALINPVRTHMRTWTSEQCQQSIYFICEQATTPDKTCQPSWLTNKDRCYIHITRPLSWSRARQYCQQLRADLVIIDDEDEQLFIIGLINQKSWLGLHRDADTETWEWSNGVALEQDMYEKWAEGEPHWRNARSCVVMHTAGQAAGQFENINCNLVAGGLCQAPADNNGSCLADWYRFEGNCYHLMTSQQVWKRAGYLCVSFARFNLKAGLANIKDQKHLDFIKGLISEKSRVTVGYWIGMTSDPDAQHFYWSDGEELTLTDNWLQGAPQKLPSEWCVEMYKDGPWLTGSWRDADCNLKKQYICQKPAVETYYDFQYGNSVYKLIEHTLSWHDAAGVCKQALGSDSNLLAISDASEWAEIQTQLAFRLPHTALVKVWFNTIIPGLTNIEKEDIKVGRETLSSEQGCLSIHKYQSSGMQGRVWSATYTIMRSPCCQGYLFICEKTIAETKDTYDFALNSSIYKIIASSAQNMAAANATCKQQLDGEGSIVSIETEDELRALAMELRARHSGVNNSYFVDVNFSAVTPLTEILFRRDRVAELTPEKSCWTFYVNTGQNLLAVFTDLLEHLQTSKCSNALPFVCERRYSNAEELNSRDKILEEIVLIPEQRADLPSPDPNKDKSEDGANGAQISQNSQPVCTGLCVVFGVISVITIIGCVVITTSIYFYFRRHKALAFMYNKQTDEMSLASSSPNTT